MALKHRLFSPGPVQVSLHHLKETLDVSLHHRTPEAGALMRELVELMRYAIGSTGPVYVLTSSGTGAMECAVANGFAAGERVLVVNTGVFGARFRDIALTHGLAVTEIETEAGVAVDPAEVRKALDADPSIKGVLMQLVDTSTTIRNDVASVGSVTHDRDVLLVVDTVSGLIANPYSHDGMGADITVCASQKGLEAPPGLAFVTVSARARAKILARKSVGSYYFDLRTADKFAQADPPQTPFTPAFGLFKPMISKLRELKAEGLPAVARRHARLAQAVRDSLTALGFPLLAAGRSASDTLTAFRPPEGILADNLVRALRDKYGYIAAGGQEKLSGKIVRIGHIGDVDIFDTVGLLGALECALVEFGHRMEPGAAVRAAMESWHRGNAGGR